MGKAVVSTRVDIGGMSITNLVEREDNLPQAFEETVAAGKAGTLSTRTDDNTGILTVASGHGITDADTVAVFWDGGSRYGMTVSATTSTTISIDGGAGDNLPVATTAIVVGKEEEHALAIDGDAVKMLVVGSNNRASFNFRDSGDSSLLRYDVAAKEGRLWYSLSDVTNPLAGDTVANVVIANGGTTEVTLKIGILVTTD